jgi:hypothetical protein
LANKYHLIVLEEQVGDDADGGKPSRETFPLLIEYTIGTFEDIALENEVNEFLCLFTGDLMACSNRLSSNSTLFLVSPPVQFVAICEKIIEKVVNNINHRSSRIIRVNIPETVGEVEGRKIMARVGSKGLVSLSTGYSILDVLTRLCPPGKSLEAMEAYSFIFTVIFWDVSVHIVPCLRF